MRIKIMLVGAVIAVAAALTPVAAHAALKPPAKVTCEQVATVIIPPVGMPANYDFRLCGYGMPAVTISCPSSLPQPGRSETCWVTPAKR